MSKKDGGPAYPGDEKVTDTFIEELSGKEFQHYTWQYQSGMSLRDWFAGLAMQAFINKEPDETKTLSNPKGRIYQNWIASDAYYIADAMIEEREK